MHLAYLRVLLRYILCCMEWPYQVRCSGHQCLLPVTSCKWALSALIWLPTCARQQPDRPVDSDGRLPRSSEVQRTWRRTDFKLFSELSPHKTRRGMEGLQWLLQVPRPMITLFSPHHNTRGPTESYSCIFWFFTYLFMCNLRSLSAYSTFRWFHGVWYNCSGYLQWEMFLSRLAVLKNHSTFMSHCQGNRSTQSPPCLSNALTPVTSQVERQGNTHYLCMPAKCCNCNYWLTIINYWEPFRTSS